MRPCPIMCGTGRGIPRRCCGTCWAKPASGRARRVLDIGCGPGLLANGFAALGCRALGIDPSEAMLAAARDQAKAAGVVVDYRQGSSYSLADVPGPFDLAVLGRSFHWTDRAATLAALDKLIVPRGAVVLFYDMHPRCTENAFVGVFDRVRETIGPPKEMRTIRKSGELVPDEFVFLDSPFTDLLRIGIVRRRALTVNDIIGHGFSVSDTTPEFLGVDAERFEDELRRRLLELRPDGQFTELIEFVAMIGRRP